MIALPTFFLGVSIALYATFVWERHVSAVSHVGKSLAEWADLHGVTVMINVKPINLKELFGSALTSNGCVEIFITIFYPAELTGPYTPEWKNLSSAIQGRKWQAQRLPYGDEIKSTTPEQLAEDLRPLGKLEFISYAKTE